MSNTTETKTETKTEPNRTDTPKRLGSVFSGDVFGGGSNGSGENIADMIERSPVVAALTITGETENAKARSTFNHYGTILDGRTFREILHAFNAEIKAGEEPQNRGAALTARLKRAAGE